jgi:hypothetical protein
LNAIKTNITGYHLLNIIGSYQAANFLNLAAAKDVIGYECNEK